MSVDRSETAIAWAKRNLALNSVLTDANTLVHAHVFDFLADARRRRRFDLAVVDPPSYSTTRVRGDAFDVAKDHPKLLEAVLAVMRPGGTIYFSTNHQRFEPRMEGLGASGVREITGRTIPEDYRSRKKTVHRCWLISV